MVPRHRSVEKIAILEIVLRKPIRTLELRPEGQKCKGVEEADVVEREVL